MSTIENVKTLNSFLRTLLVFVAMGAIGYGFWWGYTTYIKPGADSQKELEKVQAQLQLQNAKLEEQQLEIQRLTEENTKLETANRLLKVDHLLAHIEVIETGENEVTNEPWTKVRFQEVDANGKSLAKSKEFTLAGSQIHVSGHIVKFDDNYIEEADLQRGTSLFMFRSIHGDLTAPQKAHSLETDTRPGAYSNGKEMSDFEKGIWKEFWAYANDRKKSGEQGIRAAHGETKFVKAEEGQVYEVSLRASDGVSIKPIDPKLKKTKPEDDDAT